MLRTPGLPHDGRRPRAPVIGAVCRLLPMLGLLLVAARAFAPPVDWSQAAAEETVIVVTKDADGASRETTVWLVVVDGAGFVRTGGTHWGDNVERDPNVTLRIAGRDHPVEAERVTDPALLARVNDAFRAKYGTSDWILGFLRWGGERIFRVAERSAALAPGPARPGRERAAEHRKDAEWLARREGFQPPTPS